jgi:hypothetical protein
LVLISLLSFSAAPLHGQAEAPEACEGTPEARLIIGEQGRVLPGAPNNLRFEPSTESDIISEIPAEAAFYVMDGVTCGEGYTWWQVGYNEFVGWTVENMSDEEYAVEPLPVTTTPVTFGGMSFDLDSRVAATAMGQFFPSFNAGDTAMPFWLQTPAYINFALDGDFENQGTMAPFAVFPAKELGDVQQTPAFADLGTLLADTPADGIPVELPVANMERVFVARTRYLEFEGGSGVSFVAYYSVSGDPLTSGSLWYVFQGLTDQGEQYVQVFYPIATSLFPATIGDDFDYSAFLIDYEQYLADAQLLVDEADDNDFAPPLYVLDSTIETLSIDPVAVAATFAGDATLTVRCEITAFESTTLRTQPDVESAASDQLPRNLTVLADAQFQRRGEPFPWWRLATNEGLTPLPGITSLPGRRWIRADFVREDGNCAGLPVVAP